MSAAFYRNIFLNEEKAYYKLFETTGWTYQLIKVR